jgi:hypothetical protein
LSVIGCTLYPTINGAMITGGAASYTVAGCSTSGQPGFVVQEPESASTAAVLYSSGSIYNFSAFNVGELAAGGYTAPSVGYQTYSNTFNSASFSIPYPQWMMTSGTNAVSPNAGWPRLLSPVAVSGGYAAGVSGVSGSSGGMQYEFREPFGVNQWQVFQWANSSWGAQTDGVFAPLRHRTEQPGALNGNCAAIGGSTATGCVDYVGYYPGIEPFNGCTATSTRAACASTKNEYIETPFGHITKITPLVSESSNNVITVTGSTTSVATGDWWLVEYNNGYLNTYCAQSPTGTLGSWQAAHAYTAGTALEIAGGMYQVAQTTGTSGATAPAWPTQWNSTTNYGNTVTDGGVKWMYYGDACPTTYPKFTRFIHAYDSDLLTGYGVPGMFETNFDYAAGALPMFRNWSAGTMGYGTGYPCTTAGMSCVAPMEYIPTSFLP